MKLIDGWLKKLNELKIPVSDKCSLDGTMGDPVQIQDWSMDGLPMDSVSVSNGIIVTWAKRKPLMIDPQLQGTKWIKKSFENKDLHVVRMNDNSRIANTLEFCIK